MDYSKMTLIEMLKMIDLEDSPKNKELHEAIDKRLEQMKKEGGAA